MHFVPHTDDDVRQMLDDVGLSSLDELFASIPAALRLVGGLDMAPGLAEVDVADEMARLAARNLHHGKPLVCFAGGGAYDHDVPAVVRRVGMRGEFVTAYTPYQPEVAQGVLQALFEYQTLVSRLTGLPVANASLYDGATALAEAINLAVAEKQRSTVWVSRGLHPLWREVARTLGVGPAHTIVEIPLDSHGRTTWPTSGEPPSAVVVAQANHLGVLEDLAAARSVADSQGALLLVAHDPVAAGLLNSPGSFGADVVWGEGQPFGTPLSFGGPYVGYFAVSQSLVRRLPGRLVGETLDVDGRRGYVTTLRAREQDIRREKASSNVCTNQTLIAVAFTIQLAWLGTRGLRDMAVRCARGTRYTREQLLAIEGVNAAVDGPVLREFAVQLPMAADLVVERLADEGFLAGIAAEPEYDPTGRTLVVAVTERRTRTEIDEFVTAMRKVVR